MDWTGLFLYVARCEGTTSYKGKSEQVYRLHYDKVGKLANLVGM
jgi:hypothetical protein